MNEYANRVTIDRRENYGTSFHVYDSKLLSLSVDKGYVRLYKGNEKARLQMKFLEDTRVKADQLLNISHLMTTITMMMVMKTTPTMTVCTRGKEAEREEYYKQSPIAA
ncbi:hypothetical protein WUBG_03564 [Wuchereria bancrofti]|uniref:Uncharacterized protein n=1 Tax=Wuchereria bancrofti TaxID=6293 RepID=J9FDU3_WUCBA|nr:hypothetical protein WUBG_03564 [Wuchereria bancrofti]